MTSALSIPAVELPAHLGVPALRTLSELADLLDIDSSRLMPSRLVREGPTVLALRYTVARLRGERIDPIVSLRAWHLASVWADVVDGGESCDVGELSKRLVLWGMPTDLEWVEKLIPGAAEQFAIGGWAAVRRFARGVVEGG